MEDLIPLKMYFPIYINTFLFFVFFTLFHTWVLKLEDPKNIHFIKVAGLILFIFLLVFLGFRPVSGKYFGDMNTYSFYFEKYARGEPISGTKDLFFHVFMKALSGIVSMNMFFAIIFFIYMFPMLQVSVKLFKKYWYYSFLMFLISFSFYSYGTNGIRNGAATSLFLLGLSFKDNKKIMILCFLFSVGFHKTMFLPIIAYTITYFYNNPKAFLGGWLACIPLSLLMGSVWVMLFSSLGFADERLAGYLSTEADSETFSSTGFRWDFLFHSAFAVVAGWYFVIKKGFKDNFYNQLLNTYLICNGFWILVINANYSNRFAYLSWFMMALVIIYPLLKERFFKNQHFIIGVIVFIYFMFLYAMYYVYYN